MEDFLHDKDGKIPFKTHTEHHIWIHEKRTLEEKRQEMIEKVKTSLVTGAIFSFFSALGGVVWYAVVSFVQHGGK